MITVRLIDADHKQDINIPNQSFPLFGRMIPSYIGERWNYSVSFFDQITEMCFPDENYDFDAMKDNSVFIGAYEDGKCIGLAILQQGFFKYMYLYDLKVNAACRGHGVGRMLIDRAKTVALDAGYRGIYTQGQDNNLGACLFYLKNGFRIGGFDSEVYKGTNQAEKSDIIFYLDC